MRLNDQLSFSCRHLFFIMFIRFFYSHLILILTHFVFLPGGRGLGQGVLTTDTELWKHRRIRRILQCSALSLTNILSYEKGYYMEIWRAGLTHSQICTWTLCSLVLCPQNITFDCDTWVSLITQPTGSAKQSLLCPFHLCFVLISSACFLFIPFLPEQFFSTWTHLRNVCVSKSVTISNISHFTSHLHVIAIFINLLLFSNIQNTHWRPF